MKLLSYVFLAVLLLAPLPRTLAQGRPSSAALGSGVAALFDMECAGCHGDDGYGVQNTPGLPDLRDAAFQRSRTDQQFANSIMNGKNLMPTFKLVLDEEQVRQLVAYVRKFPSSPAAERQVRTNCASCHGAVTPGSFIEGEQSPKTSGSKK
jgi:mono/diheme cytochrome c family protein